MSSNTDAKLDPAEETVASSEPRLAQPETELATNPKGNESLESADKQPATYTDMASNAAASATTAAVSMKDNVFSMFGGGAKKEKKAEAEDDTNEPSGSSKAKKDAEDEDVKSPIRRCSHMAITVLIMYIYYRTPRTTHPKSTSSRLFI